MVTTDFISQTAFENDDVELPNDLLGHDQQAKRILDRVVQFPPGSVIAIQGPWGRGKTDVLARVAKATYDDKPDPQILPQALWINPWQYGTSDLLTPLVLAILRRIPAERRSSEKSIRMAAETVLRAGTSLGFKAASAILPAGMLYGLVADPVDRLLGGLFGALNKQHEDSKVEDPDPVFVMGQRFSELIEVLLSEGGNEASRVLICVDDLDRCLPHSQVALLEAIRFLTSTGARATFLISLDPTLAKEAIHTHYGTSSFDAVRYLDKMFHHRTTLSSVDELDVKNLVQGILDSKWGDGERTVKEILQHVFPGELSWIVSGATQGLTVPDLRSPRIIEKAIQRLCLLALSGSVNSENLHHLSDSGKLLMMWLTIIERWPELRAALQDAGSGFPDRFSDYHTIHQRYRALPKEAAEFHQAKHATLAELPSRDQSPQLSTVLDTIINLDTEPGNAKARGQELMRIDLLLVEAGL